jgi:chemotaxis protein CheD
MVDHGDQAPRQALPGFESITRYWDPVNRISAAKIKPGQFYVTNCDEMIVTVLGSCVAACIRDPETGVGGMNHFLLSASDLALDGGSSVLPGGPNRYGIEAMESLIRTILRNGGNRHRLEVKLFGAGNISGLLPEVSAQNIEFVRSYMTEERLSLKAEDLGDTYPRKVYYFPSTGRALVKKLRRLRNRTIERREADYLRSLGGVIPSVGSPREGTR